jgi:hypothetical protein
MVTVTLSGSKEMRPTFPGTALHLRSCPGYRADHEGLLEAARKFGDAVPE